MTGLTYPVCDRVLRILNRFVFQLEHYYPWQARLFARRGPELGFAAALYCSRRVQICGRLSLCHLHYPDEAGPRVLGQLIHFSIPRLFG